MAKAGATLKSAALWFVLLLLALYPAQSRCQEGYWGHGHAFRHFYKRLLRPDTGNPCCGNKDCRPTSGRRAGDHYEVKVNGAWISVPANKIVKQKAPDLGYHVCAGRQFGGQPQQLYCVVVPPVTAGLPRSYAPREASHGRDRVTVLSN